MMTLLDSSVSITWPDPCPYAAAEVSNGADAVQRVDWRAIVGASASQFPRGGSLRRVHSRRRRAARAGMRRTGRQAARPPRAASRLALLRSTSRPALAGPALGEHREPAIEVGDGLLEHRAMCRCARYL